jgi:inward rectifier potassium channel
VIGNRNGKPHLMFRMANWRHNQILDAQLTVLLLLTETTTEGETLRKPTPLKLVRDRTALFFLTFLAMHEIDESSPLFGEGAIERLDLEGATMILSLNGTDETLAAPIHARHVYQMTDIVVGARFADVLNVYPDGRREIDYRKFDEVVPVEVSLGPARGAE